jgi:oxygen-independent coproporphyrinogen-3 oxidase
VVRAVSYSVRAEHLYVHVPFCGRRCVYCDFAIAVRQKVPVEDYLRGIELEMESRHSEANFDLGTLYFGGGTPSKLGGDGVARLMDLVRRYARIRADAEVTLEANPDDVEAAAVASWMSAGITRVSLGVQSFDDSVLQWMHRTHDARQASRAVRLLQDAGLSNVSVDLIFAMPDAIPRNWERDLELVAALRVPHVSVYGLTVEPHTPLGRWVSRSTVAEAPEDLFEAQYLLAHDALTGEGFDHYEVSNYGRPGSHSRHNWAYWSRRAYGGIGPSAHEFDGARRRWNVASYADWLRRSESGQTTAGVETLTEEQIGAEEVYLSLRTTRGIERVAGEDEHLTRLIEAGWARVDEDQTMRLTGPGWLRLDTIASDLTLLRSR